MFIADLQDSLERRAADLLLSSIEQRNHISSPLIGCGSGFLCNERVRRTGPDSSSRRWNRNRRSKSREASEKQPHPCKTRKDCSGLRHLFWEKGVSFLLARGLNVFFDLDPIFPAVTLHRTGDYASCGLDFHVHNLPAYSR